MKKIISGITIGIVITLIGVIINSEIHTIHCEYCGELFNNTHTVEKNICDICYGYIECEERNN